MASTSTRDPLMPRDLDDDGQVCWWALGTIARTNDNYGADSTLLVTSDQVAFEWDEDDWAQLLADTPQIAEPFTAEQRARLIATLSDLERQDIGELDTWWSR